MDDFMKGIYIAEIKTQCQFALSAISNLNHSLAQVGKRELSIAQNSYFHSEVFRQTHSFLTHTSNISRLFWPIVPVKKKNETQEQYSDRLSRIDRVQRANLLKQEFDMQDIERLKDRTLRDHLEHYDERLDHWRSTSKQKNIASDTIGSRNAIVGLDETDMMRWFDPTTNCFLFRGEQYDLQALTNAVVNIKCRSECMKTELWERMVNRTIAEANN